VPARSWSSHIRDEAPNDIRWGGWKANSQGNDRNAVALAAGSGALPALVLPLPYGAQYRATRSGLRVTIRDYDYAAGGKLVNSNPTFDDFVAAMRSGLVVLNVHTDTFNPGEISGLVTEG
jgi:hypothetical protein